MPTLNISIGQNGPVVAVVVSADTPSADSSAAQVVMGRFLVDTGANISCIDATLVTRMGLLPLRTMNVLTPMASAQLRNLYRIGLYIPSAGQKVGWRMQAVEVLEADVVDQGIDGLIGRDILDQWTCIYNGSTSMLTICY